MSEMEHLKKYLHIAHYAVNLAVVVTREHNLGDSFEDEKSFLATKLFFQKENNNIIHTLAISDVWIELSELNQNFSCLIFDFRTRWSSLEIFIDNFEKI